MAAPAPDLRILQANERTLLAWVRTGLALMAFGFVIARLAVWLRLERGETHAMTSTWLGIAVICLGVACHAIGAARFAGARRAIIAGEPIVPGARGPIVVAALVGAVGVAMIVYLLVLR